MRKFFRVLSVILVIALVWVIAVNYPRLDILTGFASKNVASGMFLAGRSQESIEEGDNGFSPVNLSSNKVNAQEKSVSSSVFGLKKRTAVYVEGLGAILINKDYEEGMEFKVPNRSRAPKELPYPYGDLPQKDSVFQEVDYEKLENVVKNAFDSPGMEDKRTRSLLVVYKDHIIAENYSEGFDKSTPILGWSMTKSITSTMYGILSRKGEIDVYEPADVPQWQKDERKNITYNDLLHMNSGLEWIEDYNTLSDVTRMLFQKSDMGAMQASKTLVGKPDSTWNYSSGTTNLLAGPLLKKKFRSQQEYLDFWYRELIDKIGMHSATIENDLSGTYVGSSYGWANTRDWAKFGLLYLNRGNWNGEQIIDSTWVDYVSTPTNTSNGRYGAQFWLNAGGHYPDAPRDLFSANGYQGQYVFIIPSKDLVIVRMGLMEEPEFDVNGLLRDVVSCIR
jgi:CubicO group peptidase (beta-lactamase class C family)